MKAGIVPKTLLLFGLAALLAACGGRMEPPAGGKAAGAPPAASRRSGESAGPASPGRLAAFVSIPPQAYFVTRVAGDRVQAQVLVQPGQAAETFEPTPKQVAALAEADLYLRIGIPFEEALFRKIGRMLPRLTVIDTTRGIRLRPSEERGHPDEGAFDPHTWLDPRLAQVQARNIRDGLILADPEGRASYEAGCEAFLRDLEDLDRRLREILAPVRGRTLLVFHPAFGYLADAYGLKQAAIQSEGKEPSARQFAQIIDRARAEKIRSIFVQPQFDRRLARKAAEAIGASVVELDDLAEDYPANMERMARAIAAGLGG